MYFVFERKSIAGKKKNWQTSITRTPIIQIVCPLMDSDK